MPEFLASKPLKTLVITGFQIYCLNFVLFIFFVFLVPIFCWKQKIFLKL